MLFLCCVVRYRSARRSWCTNFKFRSVDDVVVSLFLVEWRALKVLRKGSMCFERAFCIDGTNGFAPGSSLWRALGVLRDVEAASAFRRVFFHGPLYCFGYRT